ncbi:terminase large subunit domain-containing protein [Polycladidibacter stylochi]|uniref:terminase large subunit domain-containing protein n=1 Tax=Polycladidibacter stylochi TaxID=1807766 RepID=UPI00082FB52A|nr:terminase family protein [Pseudovibrio stylochi]
MSAPVRQKQIESAERLTKRQWAELRADSGRVTPAVGNLADMGQTDVLLGYQQRLLLTTASHQVTVVEKSRRTGATWALGADAVLTSATAKSDGGQNTYYIGFNLEMAREFIDCCGEWASAFHNLAVEIEEYLFTDGKLPDGKDNNIQAFRIRFASGFQIVALSSKPRSLRGRQGYVIIDEAAFHDDLKELLKAALALLMWGGKVCIISTHDGDENPFNQLVNDVRAGRKPYALLRFDLDDALIEGLYERICLRTAVVWSAEGEALWREKLIASYGEGAEEELYCVPSKGSGAYLPSSLIRARMEDVPVLRWSCPDGFVHEPEEKRIADTNDWLEEHVAPVLAALDPDLRHHAGLDFARVADLTVLWPLQVQRNMALRTPFVLELRNVPFEQQKQILLYVLKALPLFSSAALDGGGNGAHLAEVIQQQFGAHCIEIILFSQSFYRDNFPVLKAGFEDGDFAIPKDDDIHNDFRAIKTQRGIPQVPSDQRTLELASKGKKRHGDGAIAALLAKYASDMDVAEYAYITQLNDELDSTDEDDWDDEATLYNARTDGLV